METLLRVWGAGSDADIIAEAAGILTRGGLVAFPTETVYGLGANALDADARAKIYAAKGRPADNPLIAHIADIAALDALAGPVPPVAQTLAEAFWPGPLTLVLNRAKDAPAVLSGGLPTIAVRFPAHPAAIKLITAAGFPLAAPSANASGRPSPTMAEHVLHDLSGRVDMVIDGGPCALGLESTIVDVTGDVPCLLRPGSITRAQLRAVAGEIAADPAIFGEHGEHDAPKAPGMKYKHYAPLADVTVVSGEPEAVAKHIAEAAARSPKKTGILATDQTFGGYDPSTAYVLSAGDRRRPETIGAGLFAALRRFDLNGVEVVFAEGLPEDDAGLAVMNRLKKAAGNNVIYV